MLKKLLLTVTALLFIACNIQKKDTNIPDEKKDVIASGTNSMNDYEIGEPERYILDENTLKDIAFKALLLSENILSGEEISDYENYMNEIPMGTYFWDEFGEYEEQYDLTDNESKLLGRWMNTAMNTNPYNHSYDFFPNKFCALRFLSGIYIFIDNENKSLYRAAGTWEITDSMVKITIYSIEIEDDEKSHPNNKNIVLIEHPYTFDFINIDDIDIQGYTKKPAYDRILSEELQRQVRVKVPNRTKNLYLRNVYSIDNIPITRKNYNYFTYFPEMAKEKHTGLEIAVNPELTRKYIPVWMY